MSKKSEAEALDLEKEIFGIKPSSSTSTIGLMISAGIGCIALGISVVSFSFILPAFRKICLPYVPATTVQIENISKILLKRKSCTKSANPERLIDLGSGDGRLVFEAARLGFQAEGVELNSWLVYYSKFQAWKLGLGSHAKFYKKDLFKVDLKNYQNVIIFGVKDLMPLIEEKANQELQPGSWMIACRFPLPNSKCKFTENEGIDAVWVYEKPANQY